jgi:predicted HD superfamily hydrolase involved in NAD metabolism
MASVGEMMGSLKTEVSERRFIHSVSTMETAVLLAGKYGADADKCAAAGLLHDCAKGVCGDRALRMSRENGIELDYILERCTILLHGYLGRVIARSRFGIDDEDVLNAIANHTMGRPAMSLTEKIIFLADYIEPHRSFTGVGKLRKMVHEDLDKAVIYAIDGTIRKILSKGDLLHPRILDTRNYYILKQGESDGVQDTCRKDSCIAE